MDDQIPDHHEIVRRGRRDRVREDLVWLDEKIELCWAALDKGRYIDAHELAKEIVALADDLLGRCEVLFLHAMHEPTKN